MMHSSLKGVALAAITGLAPVGAQAATFTLEKVMVHGSPATSVSAMSHGGIVGGTFQTRSGARFGFLKKDGVVTVLGYGPYIGHYGHDIVPTSIQDNGLVAGYSYESGFIWKNGRYQFHNGVLLLPGGFAGPSIVINSGHTLAYSENCFAGECDNFVGKGNPYSQIQPCDYARITMINREGVVSGICEVYPFGSTIFLYDHGTAKTLNGPENTGAGSAIINDHGAIAGHYTDASGQLHGYILRNGKYVTFSPLAAAASMNATAFSNTGIVVGTYTDAAGAYHGFYWHNGVASELVASPSKTVELYVNGVSDAGDVAINLYDLATNVITAYVAHCHGKDC